MKLIFLLVFLAVRPGRLRSSPQLHPSFCGERPGFVQSKIVGGEAAREGEIPWQAALVKLPDQVVCGAVIISERIVLTAAHCLKLQPSSYQVWAGRLSSSAAVEECSLSGHCETMRRDSGVRTQSLPSVR